MDLKEIGVSTRNYVDSVKDRLIIIGEPCGIERPGFKIHRQLRTIDWKVGDLIKKVDINRFGGA